MISTRIMYKKETKHCVEALIIISNNPVRYLATLDFTGEHKKLNTNYVLQITS